MSANTQAGFIILVIWIAAVIGWIMNIVAIFGADFGVLTGVLVLRIVGIFVAPLGAVMGYL